MKTRQMIPFCHLLFEFELFRKLTFAFENCQYPFSWGPPLVHSGLQNTWKLTVKAVRLGFCPVQFRKYTP